MILPTKADWERCQDPSYICSACPFYPSSCPFPDGALGLAAQWLAGVAPWRDSVAWHGKSFVPGFLVDPQLDPGTVLEPSRDGGAACTGESFQEAACSQVQCLNPSGSSVQKNLGKCEDIWWLTNKQVFSSATNVFQFRGTAPQVGPGRTR